MKKKIVEIKNGVKSYGNEIILENLNLSIFKGETLAILGQNGAGKSTLLRIIGGLSTLNKGETILYPKERAFQIAYIPERFPKLNFTPFEYLHHMGKIQKLSQREINEKIHKYFDIFNMDSMKNTLIKNLSKGTIQKVAVIQALLKQPDLLLMDEPLSGQDMDSQRNFIEIIRELKRKEVTIVLACHERYLVDQLADKIIEIKNKQVIKDIPYESKKNLWVHIDFTLPLGLDLDFLKQFKVVKKEECIRVFIDMENTNSLLLSLLEKNCTILSLNKVQQENVFLPHFTEGEEIHV